MGGQLEKIGQTFSRSAIVSLIKQYIKLVNNCLFVARFFFENPLDSFPPPQKKKQENSMMLSL